MTRAFALTRDAQRWLDDQTAHIARGTYVDPGAGRITLWPSAKDRTWDAAQALLAHSCGMSVNWSSTTGR